MISEPSVLCEKNSIHTCMVAIGISAVVLVPLPFLIFACIFTWKYPALLMQNSELLRSARFLFFRFQAARYYYGLIFLSRSFVISLIPIVPGLAGDAASQAWVMITILCAYTLVQQNLHPWRSKAADPAGTCTQVTKVALKRLREDSTPWGSV